MIDRKPMTEETKKKISEALKKGGSAPAPASKPARSKEAQALYNDFTASQKKVDDMKNWISAVQEEAKTLEMPPGSKDKKLRKKIAEGKKEVREKIKKVREMIKAEKEKQKAIRQKAAEMQRVKQAQERIAKYQARIAKATLNLKKVDGLESKVKDLIGKATKPEIKKKLQERLTSIADMRTRQNDAIKGSKDKISEQQSIIKSKGRVQRVSFNFDEEIESTLLHEKKMFIWRKLSLQEERVNFKLLAEKFDEYEDDLRDELTTAVKEDLDRGFIRLKNILEKGTVAGLGTLSLISPSKVSTIVNKYAKKAYETGKVTASEEMGIPNPITPVLKTQLINLDSDMIGESFAAHINAVAKQKIKEAIEKGIDAPSAMGSVVVSVREESGKMIVNVGANIIAENVNKGRRLSFDKNISNIKGFERSEVLDGRTCNVCLSLDERVIEADDPMRKLDQVHNCCRGLWVSILVDEDWPDGPIGMPPTIQKAFDTTGGVPTVNAFKQLKKPINVNNGEVKQEIHRRLKADSSHDRKYGS